MVLRADVLGRVLEEGVLSHYKEVKPKVVFTTPVGKSWNNSESKEMSKIILEEDVVFICGVMRESISELLTYTLI